MEQKIKSIECRGAVYSVCPDGTIYGPTGKPLKHRSNDDGYAIVTMGKKGHRCTRFVHKLVALLFVPNPHGYEEVDHLDGNRMNPSSDNLEWVTHEENIRRSQERGKYHGRYVGEKNPKARITPEIVMQLRAEYKSGTTIRQLERKYGYPYNTIGNAVKGYTWTHLPL